MMHLVNLVNLAVNQAFLLLFRLYQQVFLFASLLLRTTNSFSQLLFVSPMPELSPASQWKTLGDSSAKSENVNKCKAKTKYQPN